MSNNANNCLPLASYTLAVFPGIPVAPIEQDFPVSVRITMAAIDPARIEGDEEEPATLRILKPADNFDDEDDEDDDDEDDDDEDDEVSAEDMAQIKKLIAANEDGLDEVEGGDDDEDDDEDDEMEFEEDDEDDDDEGEIEDFVVCTLSPKFGYQQTLDLVITPGEQIMFEVTGSYAIHLSGNYIEHPYDMEDEDELLALGEDDEDDEDELDEGEYDLSPDEDEVINGDERLVELMEQDDEDDEDDEDEEEEPVVEPKKILKRAAEEKKQEKAAKKAKVAFTKNLEQGPTPSEPKPKLVTRQLEGGVKIEDRTVGEGPSAKVGSKVGVRYVGKLANGKVFDSNSKGKPFYFSVGKGEVIRGWDIGVQGMKVKGERRIIIPPGMAYGKQKLPGIPPNSQLTFDVKVVNIK